MTTQVGGWWRERVYCELSTLWHNIHVERSTFHYPVVGLLGRILGVNKKLGSSLAMNLDKCLFLCVPQPFLSEERKDVIYMSLTFHWCLFFLPLVYSKYFQVYRSLTELRSPQSLSILLGRTPNLNSFNHYLWPECTWICIYLCSCHFVWLFIYFVAEMYLVVGYSSDSGRVSPENIVHVFC
jgi:hypothetical protein